MGDLTQLEEDLNNKLVLIDKGRDFWLSFEKRNSFQPEDFVVVIPAVDEEEVQLAVNYLKPFYDSKKINRLFVFTPNANLSESIKVQVECVYDSVTLTIEEMQSILGLYALYPFSDRIIIASFTLPKGRTILNLESKKGVTKEEIMAIAIYQLKQALNICGHRR